MKTVWLSIGLITAAIVGTSIMCWIMDYFDERRAKKQTWSNREHRLLSMSIKFVK